MIKSLSEFGKRVRKTHDALKDEPIHIDLIILADGSFEKFQTIETIIRPAEALTSKKGKARLLLDKAEEVLCFFEPEPNSIEKTNKREKAAKHKHRLFIDKINQYSTLGIIAPVIAFYTTNKENGLDLALAHFKFQVGEKERNGNIAFRVQDIRVHEQQTVYEAIVTRFEIEQSKKLSGQIKKCSICGESNFPIVNEPHGLIKRIPSGQSAGCALISFNENAFESYELKGNDNSSVCTNCAKNYVEGLNWLLSKGNEIITEDSKGKSRSHFRYTNRRNFGSDTAMVYWTREDSPLDELNLLESPDPGQVANLIDSVNKGKSKVLQYIDTNKFYSLTLSGAAARIAVRDWIEISLYECRKRIAEWFNDIAIEASGEIRYTPIYFLARAGQNTKSTNDTTLERAAIQLWDAALKGTIPPLWLLAVVLKRIRFIEQVEDGKHSKEPITSERAALIRLVLNRNNKKKGGHIMLKENLDFENLNPAYVCGNIFAVMESLQRAAQGKDLNAGIRERFFSFASTNPSPAFGRLMKLSQNHLTKLKHEKPGIAVILDRQLRELCSKIDEFPAVFSLEEQGQFALGYYHQKQKDYNDYKKHEELKQILEEN